MRMLQCQSYGAALEWNGYSEVVTCGACGMRYQMTPRDPRRAMMENALAGGCVAPRPILEGDERGAVYYISWLPEGWAYRIEPADIRFRYASIATPVVPTMNMYTSDGRRLIAYTTSNAYLDAPQMGMGTMPGAAMGAGLLGGILGALGAAAGSGGGVAGDPSSLDAETFIRKRPLASASQLCGEVASFRASRYGLQVRQVVQEQNQPDEIARAKRRELLKTAPPDLVNSIWSEWCRKLYRACRQDGSEYAVVAEVEVSTNGFNVRQAQQPPQGNGGFLANLMGQMANSVGQAMQQRSWQTDYELFMYCPPDEFEQVLHECDRVRESIQRGGDFDCSEAKVRQFMQQEAMRVQATINNAAAQMAADNAAHFDRMSSIIQDTNDYTTNVMHDMMASNAASHERVANMHSEMIGGYNVYQGTDDGQDWLVGVEGGWLEPGDY